MVITDLVWRTRQPEKGPAGEIWFELEGLPASVAIEAFEFAGERMFSVAEHEAELFCALEALAESIELLEAPMLPGSGGYLCPLCGRAHLFDPNPDEDFVRPTCGGVAGCFSRLTTMPRVTVGAPISPEAYRQGTALLRLSTAIRKRKE